MPSAMPSTNRRGGVEFRRPATQSLVTVVNPPVVYHHYWGGLHVPYGYSYWHVAPYSWFWWMGWPRPYPAYYTTYHAGFFTSLFMTLVFLFFAAIAVAILVGLVRRVGRS